ncbi:MAG: hypothetical protein ACRDL6_07330 [Solirubrobacterales bacterium]
MEATGSLIATHSGLRGHPGAELSAAVVVEAVGGFARLLEQRGLARSVGGH